MELHESLAALARDHGRALFSDPGAFRGALDDYLDEGTASTGTINLLTDAVRLGALDSLMSMLDTGADPASAVETAGRRLARDRGSADTAGSQWACAVLGYALGRVPESMAVSMHPDRPTAQPPAPPAPPPVTHQPAPMSPGGPAAGPGAQPGWPSTPQGAHQAPQQWGQPAASYPPPKRKRTGLVVALVAIAAVLVIGVVIGVIALTGDDDEPAADDRETTSDTPTTDSTETTESTDSTETTESTGTPEGLGGPVITGDGYSYSIPEGWTDGTDELTSQSGGGAIDSGALWGETLETARANVLVEAATSFGQTDPEALREDWTDTLERTTGATPSPVDDLTIGGQPAVGVELIWENPNGITVHQVAYLAVFDDMQYSIAVTTREGDTEALDVYQEILGTWVWQ